MPTCQCSAERIEPIGRDDIQLKLLGGFGLTIGGQDIALTPSAQRLLAFIALSPQRVQRCYAAFQLWPEHDERRAKANLRSALWRLGKVRDGDEPVDLVIASKSDLRLSKSLWVDCRDGIAAAVGQGDGSILHAALPFQALDTDLLPDWYDDWLTIERERLRQLRIGSLEDAARQALRLGRLNQAVQLALNAAAIQPLRESAHRLVVEAHLTAGNLEDANHQYSLYATVLEAQLGHEPSKAFNDLIEPALASVRRPNLVAV